VRRSLARTGGRGTVRLMRDLLILAIHLLVGCVKLLRPGGMRAVAAESLMLKHQLLIANRSRQRAPNLTSIDRFVLGLTTLFVSLRRIAKLGALVKPASSTRRWWIGNTACSFPPPRIATNPVPKVLPRNSLRQSSR